jgi:hypothetical protein
MFLGYSFIYIIYKYAYELTKVTSSIHVGLVVRAISGFVLQFTIWIYFYSFLALSMNVFFTSDGLFIVL